MKLPVDLAGRGEGVVATTDEVAAAIEGVLVGATVGATVGVGLTPPLHPASKTAMARLNRMRPPPLRLPIPLPPSGRINAGRSRQWLGAVPAAIVCGPRVKAPRAQHTLSYPCE